MNLNLRNSNSIEIDRYLTAQGNLKRTVSTEMLSRYKYNRAILEKDGTSYLETSTPIEIPIRDDDTFYEVNTVTHNRLDLISSAYYGTPELWWVLASASDIEDPLNVPIGTVIRVPNNATLFTTGGIDSWLT